MVSRWKSSWVVRGLLAGAVAAVVGVGVGWGNYFTYPGAMRIDWALIGPLVVAFAGLMALMLGLGLGGGLVVATREQGPRTGAAPLVGWSMLGATLGGTVPAALGIGGFAHLDAPYGGTANILGSSLLACAVFVAAFAPSLHRDLRLGILQRLGLATAASCITAVTLGGLAWLLVQNLGLEPSFPELAAWAQDLGLWRFSALAGAAMSAVLGAVVGVAAWIYLSLLMVVRPS